MGFKMIAIVRTFLLVYSISLASFLCSASPNAVGSSLPDPGTCGVSLGNRVSGGNRTDLNGYPWTALLLLQPVVGQYVNYGCGGALVSNQFVLTAAHCFEEIPKDMRVTKVRLGEWDILSDKDCVDGLCSDDPIDVRIAGHIIHPEYIYEHNVAVHNDIALIKLERPIEFTDFISPVCLPLAKDLRKIREAGRKFTVIGWGATERGMQIPRILGSQYKLAVEVPGVSLKTCRRHYPNMIESEMCAGGESGKDSCQGDSGGSLVTNVDGYWYQFGVVSYGLGCGLEGVPGIYTRVTSYLDWIHETMQGSFPPEQKWPIYD
ncbi:CLIP domain-containing serine protease B4-like [Uranotaenia lowii]|uniref:CLIP domain-containing serine protease B4-like n=1 Tax=Uranotaenia lowii TaxID=190385 RepID=UPI00247ABC2C|nr:CLIP domain-containing serine protease B4-like [Uranotaenia lowii]